MIDKGLPAPNFKLRDQNNQRIELAAFQGTKVCLLFFSSIEHLDNQAFLISYAKLIDYFTMSGVKIIAVCENTADELHTACKRLHIPFIVLADVHHEVRKRYDVWHQKITFGKARWITARSSLFIDENGIILKTYKRADIETNAVDALNFIKHYNEKAAWRKLSRRTKERLKREQLHQQEWIVEDSEACFGNDDLIEFIKTYNAKNNKNG